MSRTAPDAPVLTVRWSPTEVLRHVDFAAYTPAEFAEARKLMADLRFVGAIKPSRRRRPGQATRSPRRAAHGPPRAAHRRRTDRARASTMPATATPPHRAAARRQRIDGAVRARVRALPARRGRRAGRASRRSRSERDSRASRASCRHAIRTRRCAAAAQPRHRLVGRHPARRGPARRSTTRGASAAWRAARWSSILSDGWDRGDPELLAEQMARLARVAYKVVWVNPLKATPGYAPLAQGMAAALAVR